MGVMFYLGLIIAGGSASAKTMKQTINIGIYAPFSTKSAYIGRNILAAMEIAREQSKSAEINYEFYTLDAQPKNKHIAETLQKFIEARHINVLLTEGSASGTVVAPLAAKNNVIHFCLGCDAVADGKNNFQAQSPNHQRGAALASTIKPEFVAQFKEEYLSQPVTEAGYAYDIFHLLNSSALIAMKANTEFSCEAIAARLLALGSGTGVMGAFNLNKNGVAYTKTNSLKEVV
ncbi:branched-chain amino acid ABC transporter substrate-binding protein [Legionella lytica]|uniref:Branched-chain amino acid ABC transporter substrate-binding protein n=1 Tax=Legionella lytica TaxID=96232 RepID=A0ABW8D8J6_9GAMM